MDKKLQKLLSNLSMSELKDGILRLENLDINADFKTEKLKKVVVGLYNSGLGILNIADVLRAEMPVRAKANILRTVVSLSDEVRNEIKAFLSGGKMHTSKWSGRRNCNLAMTEEFRELGRISRSCDAFWWSAFERGNDAPRGGRNGDFIKLKSDLSHVAEWDREMLDYLESVI